MTSIIIAAIAGLVVGIGSTVAVVQLQPEKPIPPMQGTQKAIAQLTKLDLTKPICEPKYIEIKGDLLCRELTCLQFSRGTDSQTGGKQCESISNVQNKIAIMDYCNKHTEEEPYADCIEMFWKRN